MDPELKHFTDTLIIRAKFITKYMGFGAYASANINPETKHHYTQWPVNSSCFGNGCIRPEAWQYVKEWPNNPVLNSDLSFHSKLMDPFEPLTRNRQLYYDVNDVASADRRMIFILLAGVDAPESVDSKTLAEEVRHFTWHSALLPDVIAPNMRFGYPLAVNPMHEAELLTAYRQRTAIVPTPTHLIHPPHTDEELQIRRLRHILKYLEGYPRNQDFSTALRSSATSSPG